MTADFNELWSGRWGETQSIGPVHRHLQRLLSQTIAGLGANSVLDVGCGAGQNLATLAREGHYALTGVDLSVTAVRLAQQRVPTASFVVMDAQTVRLHATFDVVMSMQVLEHLPDGRSALSHMAVMARPWVLVSTIGGPIYPVDREVGHIKSYSKESLASTMEDAGLKVEWVTAWGFPFYSAVRALTERKAGSPATGNIGPIGRLAARSLYHLYKVGVPGRGDVVMALGKRTS
jgi:2-polyprenyl-3-methyl-5-hydroxy-6-metoxy-1,4-benzoquinol methylase